MKLESTFEVRTGLNGIGSLTLFLLLPNLDGISD